LRDLLAGEKVVEFIQTHGKRQSTSKAQTNKTTQKGLGERFLARTGVHGRALLIALIYLYSVKT